MGPRAWGARNPLSDVPKNILAEERLQAANDFSASFEAECNATHRTLSLEDCEQLRSFTKTQRYNAKLNLFGHMEQLADKRALARHQENVCVQRLQEYFTEKGYSFNGSENCKQLNAALLINEPREI